MTITVAELDQARADAESRMTSRVTVQRVSSRGGQDETTGLQNSTWVAVMTDVPMRLKPSGNPASVGSIRYPTEGGIQTSLSLAQGYMPASTKGLQDNDLIEIVSGEWAGTVWRVLEATKGDQLTSRRVPLVEESRPSEWDA